MSSFLPTDYQASDWLLTEPAFDCAAVPAPLKALAALLADTNASRRSAVLWFGLLPRHLGREVVANCEAKGTRRVPADSPTLLHDILSAHPEAGHPGTWLWGLDALLARLPSSERRTLWDSLFDLRQRPPLFLVLPESYRDFGPLDPNRWILAEPCRGLVI
jgi:hypothetical protein